VQEAIVVTTSKEWYASFGSRTDDSPADFDCYDDDTRRSLAAAYSSIRAMIED
jgi:hypothetical protein